LTLPKAKPEASTSDAAANEPHAIERSAATPNEAATEPADETGATDGPPEGSPPGGDAAGAEPGLLSRRRAAALEVRVGRRRGSSLTASEAEDAERATANGRAARLARPAEITGTRSGQRAQQRAARASQKEQPEPTGAAAAAPLDPLADTDEPELIADDADVPPAEDAAGPTGDAPQPVVAAPLPQAQPLPVRPAAEPPVVAVPVVEDEEEDERSPGQGGRRRAGRKEKSAKPPAPTKNDASHYVVAPTAGPAQMRVRHYGIIATFLLFVIAPAISYATYMFTHAVDQYESDVGFGTRTEEGASTFDFLGALGGTGTSGSKDMDILNQFVISQEIVENVDAKVDLRAMYSKAPGDPLHALRSNGTIEDLVAYWQRMVLINYDNATGLMSLRIFAFEPQDAKLIAEAVLEESTKIINDLSQTAQEDTTRYSKDVLAATEIKLAEARLAVLDFQIKNQIVDPSNVISNQLSVVSTLNQQLAGAQIELDMITGTVPDTDPRIAQLNRRIEVIRNRITEEQSKVGGASDTTSEGFAKLMADFEQLKVDQDFAQQAYLSALAAHDQALTDAQKKTRYLATYLSPTLAESSTAPNRPLTALLIMLIGFLTWVIGVLIYYAIRDRR
jgi:capsular polysaccharide transport system permease protein